MFFFSQNKLIVDTNFFIVTCIEMYTDKPFVKLSNRTGCPSGSFGMDCGGLCSDKCKTRGQCDPVTGHCIGGCVGDWKGDFCTQCEHFFL